MIIDSHCHLYDEKLKEYGQEIISNLQKNNQLAICSADKIETSILAIKLADENKNIFATVGVHPHEAESFDEHTLDNLTELSKNNKVVVAIGEIGLDYYYDFAPRDLQKDILKKQIILADKLGLPCVFHVREAMGDFLEILKELAQNYKIKGVIHSFSGSVEVAKQLIGYGLYLGINGIVTFKNANKSLDVVRKIDLEHLLIETDSPYLTPVPFRGQPNRPEYVELVAKKIAEIKSISVEQVINVTTKNTIEVFNLKV